MHYDDRNLYRFLLKHPTLLQKWVFGHVLGLFLSKMSTFLISTPAPCEPFLGRNVGRTSGFSTPIFHQIIIIAMGIVKF